MTKKKQGKSGDTNGLNGSDTADNKDINSQTGNEPEDATKSNESYLPGPEIKEESQPDEADGLKTSAKDASPEIAAEAKLAEMQDKYLRLSAEFDNYRKRTLREKMELSRNAGEKILLNLVPVIDDFERALKLMESNTYPTSVKNGIDLIYNKFRDFLQQNGIREIDSLTKEFNVDLHEAVNKVTVDDESKKGKVVEVVEKGYYLFDKVMRFAKVIVGE